MLLKCYKWQYKCHLFLTPNFNNGHCCHHHTNFKSIFLNFLLLMQSRKYTNLKSNFDLSFLYWPLFVTIQNSIHIFDWISIYWNMWTNVTKCCNKMLPQCYQMSHLRSTKCHIPFNWNDIKCYLNVKNYNVLKCYEMFENVMKCYNVTNYNVRKC